MLSITPLSPAQENLTLTCVFEDNALVCTIRNTSTNTITYSSYTIGYFECVKVEKFIAQSNTWQWAGTSVADGFYGAGASRHDIKQVAPGAIVLPEDIYLDTQTNSSFVIPLHELPIETNVVHQLRVTQFMGTYLGEQNLPVWRGRLVSNTVSCRPTPPKKEPRYPLPLPPNFKWPPPRPPEVVE